MEKVEKFDVVLTAIAKGQEKTVNALILKKCKANIAPYAGWITTIAYKGKAGAIIAKNVSEEDADEMVKLAQGAGGTVEKVPADSATEAYYRGDKRPF